MQVMSNGPRCGCGQRGCLESVASRLAIAAQAARAAYRGDAPHLLEASGTDLAQIRSGALAGAIKAGDSGVEDVIREAARYIGIAVAGFVNLMCPDMIVLGGGLVEAMPELFVERVARSANKRVMPAFRDSFEVAAAKLEDDAGRSVRHFGHSTCSWTSVKSSLRDVPPKLVGYQVIPLQCSGTGRGA